MSLDSLLLTFYGDDFTGSTDVLEALSLAGLPTVLFLQPPSPSNLLRFPQCRAVGVGGISRSQSPLWMEHHLPPVFTALQALGAPLCHYKTCSTFDSSPRHGNIGKAIELGRHCLGSHTVPLVVGAPALRRYVAFGNLFATVDGETHRIDRHPTMARHPVTPMDEGDLRRHLARQTSLPIGLVDILSLQAGRGLERFQQLAAQGDHIILFDTLDAAGLPEVGRALWESRQSSPFIAGSSGVEYALLAYWESLGLLPPRPAIPDASPVDRLLVVSGSCSPVTAKQIHYALRHGFTPLPINPARLVTDSVETGRLLASAASLLAEGQSPLLFTAASPTDILPPSPLAPQIAASLGTLAAELVRRTGVQRTVVAGGDTSGFAGQALGIQALTMIRPFDPGSPLCRIWSPEAAIDGTEILFKGGQVGGEKLFVDVRQGRLSL